MKNKLTELEQDQITENIVFSRFVDGDFISATIIKNITKCSLGSASRVYLKLKNDGFISDVRDFGTPAKFAYTRKMPCGYNYSPTHPKTIVKKSRIHGLGLFATEDIANGEYLGITHIIYNGECLRCNAGGFINHSETPNAIIEQIGETPIYQLKAVKNIFNNNEITVDYCKSICD